MKKKIKNQILRVQRCKDLDQGAKDRRGAPPPSHLDREFKFAHKKIQRFRYTERQKKVQRGGLFFGR